MRVLYDYQTFTQQNYGGISRYFSELIAGINKAERHQACLSTLLSNNIHLQEIKLDVRPFLHTYNIRGKDRFIREINHLYSILSTNKQSYDIFHPTYYDPYFIPYIKGKPFVVTFHDMIHERFSNEYKVFMEDTKIKENKRLLAEQATAIIAVSESTKQDIIQMLNISSDKIKVVYHGAPSISKNLFNQQPDKCPFLLYVGNRERYKNFQSLVKAISSLLKQHRLTLICAGGGEFNTEEQILIQSLQMNEFIKYQPVIKDETLWNLYKSALAFVFPSKYEGFGIPVLEAFACRCPCLLSNTSSLPEVAGEAALYFDPEDSDSISSTVQQVINSEQTRSELVALGIERLRKFSWQNTVRETLSVYESCL